MTSGFHQWVFISHEHKGLAIFPGLQDLDLFFSDDFVTDFFLGKLWRPVTTRLVTPNIPKNSVLVRDVCPKMPLIQI